MSASRLEASIRDWKVKQKWHTCASSLWSDPEDKLELGMRLNESKQHAKSGIS